jgi:hypothetical protein
MFVCSMSWSCYCYGCSANAWTVKSKKWKTKKRKEISYQRLTKELKHLKHSCALILCDTERDVTFTQRLKKTVRNVCFFVRLDFKIPYDRYPPIGIQDRFWTLVTSLYYYRYIESAEKKRMTLDKFGIYFLENQHIWMCTRRHKHVRIPTRGCVVGLRG